MKPLFKSPALKYLWTLPAFLLLSGMLPFKPDHKIHSIDLNLTSDTTLHQISDDLIYSKLDTMPHFIGGMNGYDKFIIENAHYPILASSNRIQGVAYIKFIVEKDGSLSNISIARNPGSGLGDEALRVIKLSPKWVPGQKHGKPVRTLFVAPVGFSLEFDSRGTVTGSKSINN